LFIPLPVSLPPGEGKNLPLPVSLRFYPVYNGSQEKEKKSSPLRGGGTEGVETLRIAAQSDIFKGLL